MGKVCEGNYRCASCGLERAKSLSRKEIKSSFTEFDLLLISGGSYLCESCLSILNDKDARFKPLLYLKKGEKQIMERIEVLPFLKEPNAKFVMTLPYSFKKHHWLYAGLSSNEVAYIGTDNRTVVIDYTKHNVKRIIETIEKMIAYGIPRNEIIEGKYSLFTESKYPSVRDLEKIIAPLRPSGAIELIVKYTPAVKSKLNYEWEGKVVLNETEKKAVALLKEIAIKSAYRKEDGMRFWEGYYKRRVNRFRDLEFNEFVSRLCGSVDADVDVNLDIVKELTEQESKDIMEEIRKKSDLLLALSYSEIRESRQTYKKRNESETPDYEQVMINELNQIIEGKKREE